MLAMESALFQSHSARIDDNSILHHLHIHIQHNSLFKKRADFYQNFPQYIDRLQSSLKFYKKIKYRAFDLRLHGHFLELL
jgi:hypothetical protein